MTRTKLLTLAATSLLVVACRADERPDGVIPVDETGEDDCPGCIDVAGMLWNLETGLQGGAFASAHASTGDRAPRLTVVLVDDEYFDSTTADLETHSCSYLYTPAMAPGSSNPSAMLDWELTLVPATDGCGDLDPDWISADLYQDLAGYPWEMVAESLDSALETWLKSWFDDEQGDWSQYGEPYYFGLTSTIDGVHVYTDSQGEPFQGHYGRAYAVDDQMNIVDDATGGSLLTTDQVAAGTDGYYEIYAYKYLTPYEDLP